jgi:HK97 family phage portal protein
MFQNAIQSELKALGLINPPAFKQANIATMGDLFSFSTSDEFYPGDAEALALAYENLVTIYRAIDIRASSYATLPLKIIQKRGDEEIDVSDKDQLFVLNSPNAFDSFYSFYYESISLLDIQGELFWNFERDDRGGINQLFSDWRSHEIKVKGDPVKLINHYERTVNGQVTTHLPEDIFYLKTFNYFSILRGFSRMRSGRANIITSLNSNKFLKKFFEQGMFPGAVAETEGKLSEPEFARLREQLQSIYGSVENMHKVALLEGGLKLNVLNKSSLSENQIIPLLDFNDRQISKLYGVPLELLADPRGGSSLSRESLRAAESVFWTNTMLPLSRQMLSEINKNLVPRLTGLENVEVKHDFSNILALREDAEKRDKRYFDGFTRGAITPNEIRQDVFSLEPISDPDMDSYYLPINLLPIGESATDQEIQRNFIDKDFRDRSKAWMKNAQRIYSNPRNFPQSPNKMNFLRLQVTKQMRIG